MPEVIEPILFNKFLYFIFTNPLAIPEVISSSLKIRLCSVESLLDLSLRENLIQKEGVRNKLTEKAFRGLEIRDLFPDVCSSCDGTGVSINKEQYEEYFKYLEMRLPPDLTKDQYLTTKYSMLKRITCIINTQSVQHKKVLIIGDDDFTSIGLAMYGNPEQIVVLEIDERIVEKLNKIALEQKFPIKAIKFDVCENLPQDFIKTFDVGFTDPPYASGMDTFLKRIAEGLKYESILYFAISYDQYNIRTKEVFHGIYMDMYDKGFIITNIYHNIHKYIEKYDEKKDFSFSSLIKLEHGVGKYHFRKNAFYGVELHKIYRPEIKKEVFDRWHMKNKE